MTRKTYTDLQEELREAQQYINLLIHDDTYAVINARSWPHEYKRVAHAARFMAVIQVPPDHNPLHVKRALHVRHPGVILIAQPIPRNFAVILTERPDDYCERVKATLRKAGQSCTCAHVISTGNAPLDLITCLELINLTRNPDDQLIDVLKELKESTL